MEPVSNELGVKTAPKGFPLKKNFRHDQIRVSRALYCMEDIDEIGTKFHTPQPLTVFNLETANGVIQNWSIFFSRSDFVGLVTRTYIGSSITDAGQVGFLHDGNNDDHLR